MLQEVIKRDGRHAKFISSKINLAIQKANAEVSTLDQATDEEIAEIVKSIKNIKQKCIHIEVIQDMVESGLMEAHRFELAKKYIIYRYAHNLNRDLTNAEESILGIIRGTNLDVINENSNKNSYTNSTQRDLIAGEVSRELAKKILIPDDIRQADEDMELHWHDIDYSIQKLVNCCLINIKNIFDNGTVINGLLIESPKSFRVACNVATQIIANIASNQYGGQSLAIKHLGKYLAVSRERTAIRVAKSFDKAGVSYTDDQLSVVVENELSKELSDGIQTIQYQLNTLQTTNGQSPFVTLFLQIEDRDPYEKEVAAIVEEILKQRLQGVKNKDGKYITPSFPKLIYVLDENNCLEGGKYDYITELAAKCTIKRSYPDYISAKVMREQFDGEVFSCMGCVDGDEVITYRYNNRICTESFAAMWSKFSEIFTVQDQPSKENKYIDLTGVDIKDTKRGFVPCLRLIRNVQDEWLDITFSNGRTLMCTTDHPFEVEGKGVVQAKDLTGEDKILLDRDDTLIEVEHCIYSEQEIIDQAKAVDTELPDYLWNSTHVVRANFLNALLEDDSFCTVNKSLALQVMSLIQQTQGYAWISKDFCSKSGNYRYIVTKSECDEKCCTIVAKLPIKRKQYSYDVTTASEHFVVSGLYSHNCRSFLSPWKKEKWYTDMMGEPESEVGKYQWEGRFNQGVVTINLPQIAIIADHDFDKFWQLLDERLAKCYKALLLRHKLLEGTLSDTSPLHWQYGGIARLESGEAIDKLLHGGFSTISLGYIGIYETVYAMMGVSHTTPEGKEFALKIMHKLTDTCESWKKETGIAFGVYGTPAESLCYKFCKHDAEKYGLIENVTDKGYYTNSYHCDVREDMNAFDKFKFEAEFQPLSSGGCISYVEIPNLEKNLPVILKLINYIYNNVRYGEFNSKSDYCFACGFQGQINLNDDNAWECPNCGNKNMKKMYVSRRTCGYLGSNEWNEGKRKEIGARVEHL